ncbi:MAG TPA: hypothetical protein PK095_15795, partial [Myxococcota bacterium]|nr:hypothetical protein [Myxococcota bacterium]
DNDCDGTTDDGFTDPDGSFTNVENCGQCGLDCRVALTNLSQSPDTPAVECREVDGEPVCVPLACAPGFIPYPVGVGVTPRVCLPLAAASCRPCT